MMKKISRLNIPSTYFPELARGFVNVAQDMNHKPDHLILDLSHPKIMGILNVTPDSFSDGGEHNRLDAAIKYADKIIQQGAAIIDVGGESTRPGAKEVSVEEELDRVIPVIEAIANYFEVYISVDTSKPEVITQAAHAGAHMINDIRALNYLGARDAAAKTGLPVCLMHMQGAPKTMQQKPHYDNILTDIADYFAQQIQACIAAGIVKEKLILDPGLGFGKTVYHNYHLLANLNYFQQFGLPLLVGMSRKSMIGQLLNVAPKDRVTGSVACAVIAAMQGVNIIRVHDVKETVEALRIVEATLSSKD